MSQFLCLRKIYQDSIEKSPIIDVTLCSELPLTYMNILTAATSTNVLIPIHNVFIIVSIIMIQCPIYNQQLHQYKYTHIYNNIITTHHTFEYFNNGDCLWTFRIFSDHPNISQYNIHQSAYESNEFQLTLIITIQ